MNNVEKQLADEKKRIDSITAPEELEMRLRNALQATAPKRRKRISPIWKIAVAALLITVVISSNYNAFAYYSKQLLGYDELINDTLKELNDAGKGQIVDKFSTLADGTKLIIDGIMSDENQLIMYYRITNPNGLDKDTYDQLRFERLSGFLTNSMWESGTSIMNEDQTEMRGTLTFKPVSPLAKKLTLTYSEKSYSSQITGGSITFAYNPHEAMQTELKKSIKKKLQVDRGTITFKTITATPTMTMIEGKLDVKNFDRVPSAFQGIELIANGSPIENLGSSTSTSMSGTTFDIHYESLPEHLDSLELVMKEFVGYMKLGQEVSLASISNEPISLNGEELWVKDVSITSRGVEITIDTEDDVMLDGVSIGTHKEIIPLKTTVNQSYIEYSDGRLLKERTLLFESTIVPEKIVIEGMHYMKTYNYTINIPVK